MGTPVEFTYEGRRVREHREQQRGETISAILSDLAVRLSMKRASDDIAAGRVHSLDEVAARLGIRLHDPVQPSPQPRPDPNCMCGKPLLMFVAPGEHVHVCPVHPERAIYGSGSTV